MTDLERIELAALTVRDDALAAARRREIYGGPPIAATAIANAFDKFADAIRRLGKNEEKVLKD